jgi:integrase
MNSPRWVTGHSEKIKARLENDVYPWLGRRPIADITPPELLATIRRIESRGAIETAHRATQNCSQVFRFAVATGRASRDITVDLRGALRPSITRHHASITEPKAIGELLRAIQDYSGSLITKCALRLAPLVFVRPGELRQAEWTEINIEAAEWRIPAARMKGRRQHIVPLARQAVEILQELGPATGHLRYVFPGEYHRRRPMSENTVNAALRRLGYTSDQMTGHGFRSMASTLLNEQGWDTEAIERQLAHVEGNSVKAAYNYAQHLPVRRKMMQAWADYLDSLSDPGLRRARELLNREINSTVYTPAEVKPRGSQRSIAQASDTDSSKQPRCDSHGRSQQNEPQRTFGETHEIHFHMLIKVASSGAHGPPSAFSPSAAI